MPTNSAVLDIFPPNFLSCVVRYSFSKFSLASFKGTDNEFSILKLSPLGFFKDYLIILETFSLLSGPNIAILSIKFLNSRTFPGQS